MIGAVEDEVVGADDSLCVLRCEVLPVRDVLWVRVEPVPFVSAVSACVWHVRMGRCYSLQ